MAENRGDSNAEVAEATLLAQRAGDRGKLIGDPATAIGRDPCPLVGVALRLYADFAPHVTLAETLGVIRSLLHRPGHTQQRGAARTGRPDGLSHTR